MDPKQKPGETDAPVVKVLPDQTFELSDGKSVSDKLGRTDIPVQVLPNLAFDLPSSSPPALTTRDLTHACRVFIELAYPEGIETVPLNKRPYCDSVSDRPIEDFSKPSARRGPRPQRRHACRASLC